MENNLKICILGMGYVGLPLAIEFGKKFKTYGYDISTDKINNLKNNFDTTGEIESKKIKSSTLFEPTNDPNIIKECDVIIIAVPTPVDLSKRPDFKPLIFASETVGKYMKKKSTVIYESTVYPGATEEICIPVLEKLSGLKWKEDFFVGYSPERVNPGDKEHTISKIVKVVSGDTAKTLKFINLLYSKVIDAGTYCADSIIIAEAAKVIENTQRDINIALMNEIAKIFKKMNIDTKSVINAARTKWNFLPFEPGLVGGHCIGVDPYYLTCKAEMLGFHPEVILAGRRVNDGMAEFIAKETIKHLTFSDIPINKAKILVLGLTFKENCSDIRNSKVIDLIRELNDFGCDVSVIDPLVEDNILSKHGIKLSKIEELDSFHAVIGAVSHKFFLTREFLNKILKLLKTNGVFIDIKSVYDDRMIKKNGFKVWRL